MEETNADDRSILPVGYSIESERQQCNSDGPMAMSKMSRPGSCASKNRLHADGKQGEREKDNIQRPIL